MCLEVLHKNYTTDLKNSFTGEQGRRPVLTQATIYPVLNRRVATKGVEMIEAEKKTYLFRNKIPELCNAVSFFLYMILPVDTIAQDDTQGEPKHE